LLNAHWAIVLSQPVTDVYGSWLKMARDGIPLLLICVILLLWLTYQVYTLETMREMETMAFQAEKSHAVSELAASVAHEVRNPITVIRGFMQLLSMRSSDTKAHEYAKLIVEEVDRVEYIIGEFLSLAKPHITKREECNLYPILHSVYMLAQGRAVYSGVDVVFDVSDECTLMGDEMQLKQVFLNLCTNAIQAMPGGGTLKISTLYKEDKIDIKITDNGQGISPQSLKRLGEQFFTTKETGTGIGLALSYRIVKNHQGQIKVVSALGKGTEFTITLPIHKQGSM
jgi:signal transduction histidine kinase